MVTTNTIDSDQFLPAITDDRTEDDPVDLAEVLREFGFGRDKIEQWLTRMKANGSSLDDEILCDAFVSEEAFYGGLARKLRLPFEDCIDTKTIHYSPDMDNQLIRPRVLRSFPKSTRSKLYLVPDLGRLKSLAKYLREKPQHSQNLIVTTRRAMRQAVWEAGATSRCYKAVTALSEEQPQNSARTVLHGRQGFFIGIAFGALCVALSTPSSILLLTAHILCSGFYFCANVLRFWALSPKFELAAPPDFLPPEGAILPVYSIFVALHREKQIIPQLVASLNAIEWPPSRLDIKIICEDDDQETLDALAEVNLAPHYEIIRVPVSTPRTKPKALQYALPSARGQYLTVFDAEDRPHPKQLREAYYRFYHGPENLACLQAPLVITNIWQSWISALFATEYAALFRRILPMLAANGFPLPLGGTSNHFKTAILRDVGGWDPFNVTEDADLGLRLSRHQYVVDVMRLPTLEDAPTNFSIWLKQRSRWYKGWLKTWLVMMRSPINAIAQLGIISFSVSQLIILGMLISALAHPLLLTYIGISAAALIDAQLESMPSFKVGLLAFDAVNLTGSYIAFLLIARSCMTKQERLKLGASWLLTPVYWFMLSLAAWWALWELRKDPFRWNKTPHVPSQ